MAVIGAANAIFRSLHDAWADTTTPRGRLILTVLGGLAEFERHLIVARISEGRKRASAWRTVRPAPQADAAQRREAIARRDEGLETLTDIAAATT